MHIHSLGKIEGNTYYAVVKEHVRVEALTPKKWEPTSQHADSEVLELVPQTPRLTTALPRKASLPIDLGSGRREER